MCGSAREPVRANLSTCQRCAGAGEFVRALPELVREFVVVVDGSHSPGTMAAGAGLVLVHRGTCQRVAQVCCRFEARDANEAEYQAIVRASRWVPNVPVLTDSTHALARAHAERRWLAVYLPREFRAELHHGRAHGLANQGRQRTAYFLQARVEAAVAQTGAA